MSEGNKQIEVSSILGVVSYRLGDTWTVTAAMGQIARKLPWGLWEIHAHDGEIYCNDGNSLDPSACRRVDEGGQPALWESNAENEWLCIEAGPGAEARVVLVGRVPR